MNIFSIENLLVVSGIFWLDFVSVCVVRFSENLLNLNILVVLDGVFGSLVGVWWCSIV